MAITKVWLDESNDECVSCGACEATCDAVFSVPEKMQVKEGDEALYLHASGHEIEIDGEQYVIISQNAVLLVMRPAVPDDIDGILRD